MGKHMKRTHMRSKDSLGELILSSYHLRLLVHLSIILILKGWKVYTQLSLEFLKARELDFIPQISFP